MRSAHLELTISIFLIAATIVAYWQLTSHDFVTLDDITYVTENPHVRTGLTLGGVSWSFTTFHGANWHPLTWLSHMLDCRLFGLNPGMHHITNLLFHTANTLLLFLVLGRATGSLWRSAFVAGLFALHPLHVESVAWVAERKDVLSTFFWMLTLWAYVRYVELPCLIRYLLILLFFILGLMTKPMLVTLPFVLLLMDYWPLGRMRLGQSLKELGSDTHESKPVQLLWEKIPLFALTGISTVVTFFAESRGGIPSLDILTLNTRISNAFVSYVSYIGKMLWPDGLAVFYPYPQTIPMWKALGAGLMLLCLTVIFIKTARTRPYLFVGWFWYVGTLIPVVGLVQVGNQAMADRYTYIPLIGLFIMIAWGIPDVLERWRYRQIALRVSAGLLFSALTVCTWLQVRHWKDSVSLFNHALNVTANNYLAHNHLGIGLMDKGRHNEAMGHFRKALRIKPDYARAHNNLGIALNREGKYEEAIGHYSKALEIRANNWLAHYNLGISLSRQGRMEAAIRHYSEALKGRPHHPLVHHGIGVALASRGRLDEAVDHYLKALLVKPDFADAHNKLGIALKRQGKYEEAISHYSKAIQINPHDPVTHYNLGLVLAHQVRLEAAIKHYSEAIRLKPDFADAYTNLGTILANQGRIEAAIKHYSEALRLKPQSEEIHINIGTVLAYQGKLDEAIRHYSDALQINPRSVHAHNGLGLALMNQGSLDDAIWHFNKALRIKPDYATVRRNLERALKLREK